MMPLDAKIPEAPIEHMWETHREHLRLVGPRNRPQYRIIVVGSGLAGAAAASSLGAMGYRVECFCFGTYILNLTSRGNHGNF